MIAIIDYDAGNLRSVEKAMRHLGQDILVTRDTKEILAARKVILPGVGSFRDAMEKLKTYGLVDSIKMVIDKGTPFLGICLGQQLLFESSEEGLGVEGLSVLKGKIKKFPQMEGFKIPHMGWNSLNIKKNAKLFEGLQDNPYVYFVHSYYLEAEDESVIAATADYCVNIHASVEKDNIFGCQFHPEKSGDTGLKMLNNFANL